MQLLLQQVFQWWAVLFFIGIIFLPFVTRLFASFFDKGYIFAKIIGLIFITYIMLVLGSAHVAPFTFPTLTGIILFSILLQILIAKKTQLLPVLGKTWKIFLSEEILFFAALFFWSYIKSFQPDIHGLEKFMDYGFLNSILRSSYFPPRDMWMTPLSINYYYFGHLMTAVVTRLSLLSSTVTFNLMLASLFAFTFTEGFSLGANFVYLFKKHAQVKIRLISLFFVGLFTAFLLTFSGNLHSLYTFFTPYQNDNPVPPTQLVFSPTTFPNQYWYPNATRFIYHTIHEFPIYSFVVSDLHGHVLDIPSVLLMIGILLIFFFDDFPKTMYFYLKAILIGSLCAVMYMTNAWDGLIYIGVGVFIFFIRSFSNTLSQTLFSKKFLVSASLLLVSFVVVSLPFSLFFKPFASQIGINCAPDFLLRIGNIGPIIFEQGYCQHSPLWQLSILYGFFFFWFVSLLGLIFKQQQKDKRIYTIDLFVAGLGSLGFILIILPEFVYLKDIYTTYFRANTMFKLVYQSFILLSLVSGYTFYRILSQFDLIKKSLVSKVAITGYLLVAGVLLILISIYPYFAISSYFDNLKDFKGLDGTTYLLTLNKDDYEAIQWLNKNILGQPVVLEAQGDSYTDYERISSNTGLPTVFGWMVHEWLWRGTYSIVPGRVADVKNLYESTDLAQTKSLLQKYHVQYVYVGSMERTKYPLLDEEKFNTLGKVVYASGSVKIYKIL